MLAPTMPKITSCYYVAFWEPVDNTLPRQYYVTRCKDTTTDQQAATRAPHWPSQLINLWIRDRIEGVSTYDYPPTVIKVETTETVTFR